MGRSKCVGSNRCWCQTLRDVMAPRHIAWRHEQLMFDNIPNRLHSFPPLLRPIFPRFYTVPSIRNCWSSLLEQRPRRVIQLISSENSIKSVHWWWNKRLQPWWRVTNEVANSEGSLRPIFPIVISYANASLASALCSFPYEKKR